MQDGDRPDEPRQKTQPKGKDTAGKPYDPVEIPIPEREAVLRDLMKVAPPPEPPAAAKDDD